MSQVSVIIPTHNRARFLREAISSVLNQTFQDFEILVVDDASDDNTREVVAGFEDIRIKYFRHDTNRGGSAARNTGIRNSKCNYIAFLDDDDEWFPEKLGKQMAVLLASAAQVGCVYTGYLAVDRTSGGILNEQIPTKRGDLSRDLRVQNCVGGASAALLRRACLEQVGPFDENLPRSQDYDLWIRISTHRFLFEYVQEPLFKYHVHEHKISTDRNAISKGLEDLATKYANYPLSKKMYANEFVELGVLHCLSGNISEGRRAILRSIWFSPLQTRGYYNLCLTLCGARNFGKVKAKVACFVCFVVDKAVQVRRQLRLLN